MKRQAWLVPILALSVPFAAHAQIGGLGGSLNDQVDKDETVLLSPFEVSSDRVSGYRVTDSASARVRRALIETPISIQVVTSEFMDSIGAASVLDATQYLSGMSVPILGGVGGVQERQVVRGFNAYGIGIDSFRLRTNAGQIDPAILDRVEVLKGPNPLLVPGTHVGGFATTVTKSPQFKSANSLKVEVADEYFGSRAVIDSTGAIPGTERFAYRLIGTYRDAKSYVPGRVKIKSLSPMLTWRISENSQLKLKGILNDWEHTGAHAQNPNNLYIRDDFPYGTGATVSKADIKPGYTPWTANGSVDWTERFVKTRLFSAEFTTKLTNSLNLRLAALRESVQAGSSSHLGVSIERKSLLRIDPHTGRDTPNLSWALTDPNLPWDEQTNPYVSTPIPVGSDITKVAIWAPGPTVVPPQWEHNNHFQADLSGKFDIGGSSNEPLFTLHTVVGAYHTAMAPFSWVSYPSITEDVTASFDKTQPFLPNAHKPTGPVPDPYLPNGNGRTIQADSTQYYANVQVDTFRNRLLLSGGWTYYKRFDENINGTRYTNDSRSRGTPSAGILYRVTPNASIYASFSQNTSRANWYPGGGLATETLWREGQQQEVGVKTDFFNRRLSISASYFEIEENNIAVDDPRDVEANRTGINRLYPQLLNDITNEGVEFDISGQITPNLSVLGSFTKQKKRNQAGFREANTPDTLYNAFVRYGFSRGALDGLSVHAGFNHSGKAVGSNPSTRPTALGVRHQYMHFLPARTIFNAGASYKWSNINFQLNIDNLLDEDKPMNSQGRHDMGLVPPRNIRLTMTYNF